MKAKYVIVISVILFLGSLLFNYYIKQSEEKSQLLHVQKVQEYEDKYRNAQELRVEKLRSVLTLSLENVNNDYFLVKVKNNTKEIIRHFNFNIFLLNSFNESIGFGNSGSGLFKYESIEASDLIEPNKTYEFYFSTKGIEDFNKYYINHGNNLKGHLIVDFVKFNNKEEFNSFILGIGFQSRTFEEYESMVEFENQKVKLLQSYF